MSNFPQAQFGKFGASLDWRKGQDTNEDDDDNVLEQTPPGVATMLGFDPLELGGAADEQPDLPGETNEDGDEDEAEAVTPSGLVDALGFDPLELMAEDSIQDANGSLHDEGNGQFTSGGGGGKGAAAHAEAKAAASKSLREGLRKLFKTGHSFSVGELSEILGVSEKATKTALAHIKNPKKATAKFSTLELVQDPATGQYSLKKMSEASIAAQNKTNAAAQESAGLLKFFPMVAEAPKVKLSAEQADKNYASRMKDAAYDLVEAAKFGHPQNDALLNWKNERAFAMAQWKADTTGQNAGRIKQELFYADEKLWDDVKNLPWSVAFQNWKQNTAAEKNGNLKKPGPEYESTAPVYEAANAADYMDKNKIPASYKQIGKNQFKGKTAEDTDYYKGFTETHQKFEEGSGGSDGVNNKIVVQKDIEARLKKSEAFQKIQADFSKAHKQESSLVRRLVGAWASSSGDHHGVSAYMQYMVADVFGMKNDDIATGHIQGRNKSLLEVRQMLGNPATSTTEIEAGMRDFVRAQYDNTQQFLKDKGIKDVYVARGMKLGNSNDKAQDVDLRLQPASSFSHSHYTAAHFAGTGNVYMVKVPASQVLGSYRTGYGCTNEQEVTLLASPGMRAVSIGKAKAATANEAIHYTKQELGW